MERPVPPGIWWSSHSVPWPGAQASVRVGSSTASLGILLTVHVVLAFAASDSILLSTAWAWGTLLVGLAVLGGGKPDQLTVVAAYLAGAEIVWRGTGAVVFYEFGKYALILLLGLGILRYTQGRRFAWEPLLFATALTPSLAVLPYFDRSDVSFNLSGPVALAVATMFFAGRRISRRLLVRMSEWALAPIVGLGALAAFGILEAGPEAIRVGSKASTAGIGSNQVSSVLGLGVLLAFVCLLVGPRRRSYRILMGAVGVWLMGQTLLSLSRGGLWTTVGALLVAAWCLARTPRMRRNLLVLAVCAGGLTQFVVLPAIDAFASGEVSARFADVDLTGRGLIMEADWHLFLKHPLFGVGPGQSYEAHAETYRAANAHTEYTRLLAEHGMFGVLAMVMLGVMVWRRWQAPVPLPSKAWTLAFTAWALLYMFHSAMRLVAPAFLFGIGAAALMVDRLPAARHTAYWIREGVPLRSSGGRP